MSIISKLRDTARTTLGMRAERRLPSAGTRPMQGAHIAKEDVCLKITDDIPQELWQWMTIAGWRVIFLQSDRRRYRYAPKRALERLIEAPREERETIETAIMKHAQMTAKELKRRPIGNVYARRRESSIEAADEPQQRRPYISIS